MYDAYKGSAASPVAVAMVNAGRAYPDMVRRAGKGHSLGQLEVHQYMGGMRAAIESEKLVSETRNNLKRYFDQMTSPKALGAVVEHCKCTPLFDRGTVKIKLSIKTDVSDHIVAYKLFLSALSDLGFTVFEGCPPRSNLERQLQSFIDSHTN